MARLNTIKVLRGTAVQIGGESLAAGEIALATDTNELWVGTAGGNVRVPMTFATPSVALGSEAAAGDAATVIRSNSTIAAFDATVPSTQAFGDSAATGEAAYAARRDHKHAMPAALTTSLTFVIDGGGSVITTGIKGDLEVPFACTINQATLLADQSGSIKIDIWKDTYANYPPDNADTITGANEPEISSATKDQDGTLTDWTTSISAGDILRFNVDSCTTITRCTVSLKVTRS